MIIKKLSAIISFVRPFLFAFIFAIIINQFLIINAYVPSSSMESTVMTNDRVLANRVTYYLKKPERYDIVVFQYPDEPATLYVKRVIGLSGETVTIKNGKVYVNGSEKPLIDDFCKEPPSGDYGPFVIPQGHYFMLGDNRENSNDSRFWKNHYVKENAILGKVILRYYPTIRRY